MDYIDYNNPLPGMQDKRRFGQRQERTEEKWKSKRKHLFV
jgi:hypothetical protein